MSMRSEDSNPSALKHRVFYGAVVGAFLGMIIGTMPGNAPVLGLAGMAFGAVVVSALAALSKGFWESLCAVWEIVRMAFWRW